MVKQFTEAGPNGGTVGLVIPVHRLGGGRTPADPEFLAELSGLLAYARRRADRVAGAAWASLPLPRKVAIVTDVGGYGEGVRYGVRTTDPAVLDAECGVLRQMGVNGLRNAPGLLLDRVARGEGLAGDFRRVRIAHGMGFPVPKVNARDPAKSDPEAGCPFAPGVAARTRLGVEETLAHATRQPAAEVWALTVDEIGAVFDAAPEGKAHVATCPHCAARFRGYLRERGLQLADLGATSWDDVRPADPAANAPAEFDRAAGLQAYHTAMFVNYATAQLFTPLREALRQANRATRLARQTDPAAELARRPLVYSYALRGNTYLMGGHSLDFFDFYRHADNGFVYETSNRDPRIWHWDSHLCDVGRIVASREDLQFGIYVKPHRGAPIQRAMSALARGATLLYWYTYGPDWAKGDTFAGEEDALAGASRAARLIAASEETLYGAQWAESPQIAIVSPRSSEIWMRRTGTPPDRAAAWENAKWIYTALTHAHLPVDPLDEGALEEWPADSLRRYRVIYISGPNLTAAATRKLAAWVAAGGVLVTTGGGMRCDEANQPSDAMNQLLGLKSRQAPEMWKRVKLYGATALESFMDKSTSLAPPPLEAALQGVAAWDLKIQPVIGREILDPAAETQIHARYLDGGVAVTQRNHGRGQAIVCGLFPGLEYSAAQRTDQFDLRRDLDEALRRLTVLPCRDRVAPVVDCNSPTVEAVLLRNPATGKLAVVVLNWTYRIGSYQIQGKSRRAVPQFVALQDVQLTIRAAAPRRILRASTHESLPHLPQGDHFIVTLPRLDEAEVLLLE